MLLLHTVSQELEDAGMLQAFKKVDLFGKLSLTLQARLFRIGTERSSPTSWRMSAWESPRKAGCLRVLQAKALC